MSSFASSGTYAKALLRQLGLTPPLERWPDFPREVLAATAGSYFAGELFVAVRSTKLPIMTLDLGGAYGIAASLNGAWRYLFAERLDVVELDRDEVGVILKRLISVFSAFARGEGPAPSKEDWCLAAWTTVFVHPRGESLPHRVREDKTWTMKRAPLTYDKSVVPYQLADIVALAQSEGPVPAIERAFRLDPVGKVPISPTTLPSGRVFQQSSGDLSRALWSERRLVEMDTNKDFTQRDRERGYLKGVVNSLFSGLPMQVNDDEPTKKLREIDAYDPRTGRRAELKRNVLEKPGSWYYPPLASAVTATARLLLCLIIQCFRS
ncbi:MAG: hypothetical protein WEA10_04875 [Actinomycetota bacterium]